MQQQEQSQDPMMERIAEELMTIAMGEKAYPEYDKNGEEYLQYPTLSHRMKAMEMLPKIQAQRQCTNAQHKRRVVVVDDV